MLTPAMITGFLPWLIVGTLIMLGAAVTSVGKLPWETKEHSKLLREAHEDHDRELHTAISHSIISILEIQSTTTNQLASLTTSVRVLESRQDNRGDRGERGERGDRGEHG